MNNPIRTVIVDDDAAFCRALRGWFEDAADILIASQMPGTPKILDRLRELQPDVILIDIAAAPPEQIRAIAALAGVIVLHSAEQEKPVLEALQAGALGHLDKQTTRPPQALAAVRAVRRGEAVLSPTLAGRIVDEVAGRHRAGGANGE